MTDVKGDLEKKRANDCTDLKPGAAVCPHIEQTYQGFELERYACTKCGKRYTLYYEDMA